MKARKTVAQPAFGGDVVCAAEQPRTSGHEARPAALPSVMAIIARRWVFAAGQTAMLQCQDGSGGPVLLIQPHDKATSGQRAWTVMFLDDPMRGELGVFAERKLHPFTADACA